MSNVKYFLMIDIKQTKKKKKKTNDVFSLFFYILISPAGFTPSRAHWRSRRLPKKLKSRYEAGTKDKQNKLFVWTAPLYRFPCFLTSVPCTFPVTCCLSPATAHLSTAIVFPQFSAVPCLGVLSKASLFVASAAPVYGMCRKIQVYMWTFPLM